jgi:hypothetical protein
MQRCQIGVLYEGTDKRAACSELSREKGQVMSRRDRDAEIAAFHPHHRSNSLSHCACVVPTQGSPDRADQAALEYAVARELLRTKSATRWQVFSPLRFRN